MANYHDEILNFEKIAKEHTEYMRNSSRSNRSAGY